MTDENEDSDVESVDEGELWRIEEVDVDTAVYTFVGKATPFGSTAVAKAKQQFARENDYEFRHVVGRKIGRNHTRQASTIVAVAYRPHMACNEVIPF